MGFSTAVAFGGNDHPFDQITAATHSFAQVQDMLVFGKELSMKEAVAVAKSGEKLFDKIVLLVSHGEASCVTEEESRTGYGDKVEGDLALTKHVSFEGVITCRYASNQIKTRDKNLTEQICAFSLGTGNWASTQDVEQDGGILPHNDTTSARIVRGFSSSLRN